MNKTISAHQTGVIAGILLFTLKMTSLPSLLYKYNDIGAIFSIIFIIAINFGFLCLLIWLKQKYQNQSFYDIIKQKLSVVIAKILYFVFFSFFFFKLLLMLSDGYTFIKDIADDEFSLFKLIICFFPVICALAYSGIRNIGRTCEFFLPLIILCLIIAVTFSIVPVDFVGLSSFTRNGFLGFFNSIFRLSFWTGDLFCLAIVLDKIEIKKGKLKQIFIPFGIMAGILLLIYILYFALYKQTSMFHINMLNDIVQYATGTSKGWHMDIFAIIVFMINFYLQGAILLYCEDECLKKVFNFKYSVLSLFIIVLALLITEFLYLTDYLKYITFAENILCYFSAITLIIVPLIIIFLAGGKRRLKNDKKY